VGQSSAGRAVAQQQRASTETQAHPRCAGASSSWHHHEVPSGSTDLSEIEAVLIGERRGAQTEYMGNEQQAIEAFEAWAATYDETVSAELERFVGITHRRLLDRLVQLAKVSDGDRVLDVGTGTGHLAICCAVKLDKGQVVGTDVTTGMLRRGVLNAERAGVQRRLHYTIGSAARLPYPDSWFDVVVSSLALHHTEVEGSLKETVRMLKPGRSLTVADIGGAACLAVGSHIVADAASGLGLQT